MNINVIAAFFGQHVLLTLFACIAGLLLLAMQMGEWARWHYKEAEQIGTLLKKAKWLIVIAIIGSTISAGLFQFHANLVQIGLIVIVELFIVLMFHAKEKAPQS